MKKVKRPPIRQGDVYLKPTTLPLSGGKKVNPINGRLILAYGEATGHHHSVSAADAELLEFGDQMMLVVKNTTTLDHHEHAPLEVQPGMYWVVNQREYTPASVRRVSD